AETSDDARRNCNGDNQRKHAKGKRQSWNSIPHNQHPFHQEPIGYSKPNAPTCKIRKQLRRYPIYRLSNGSGFAASGLGNSCAIGGSSPNSSISPQWVLCDAAHSVWHGLLATRVCSRVAEHGLRASRATHSGADTGQAGWTAVGIRWKRGS